MCSDVVPRLRATVPKPELARRPIFDPQARTQYVRDVRNAAIADFELRRSALRSWIAEVRSLGAHGAKETSLEQRFNADVLGTVLGYELHPHPQATAWVKPPRRALGALGEPDVVLGDFSDAANPRFVAVLELKAPGARLDAPQVSRRPPLSPIQQAFAYGERILGVDWVVVSDMRHVRLYDVEEPHTFIEIDLADCVDDDQRSRENFIEMYAFLSRDAVVGTSVPDSPLSRLRARSRDSQLAVRDGFYEIYGEVRTALGAAIASAASGLTPTPQHSDVVAATQRLLDRLLFIHYCEDSPSGLLPKNLVAGVTAGAFSRPGSSSHKVYDDLKLLFRDIDVGSKPTAALQVAGYNGELFKPDPIIDVIDLPDDLHLTEFSARVGGQRRTVKGVWGLHTFDFWRELNEHLLGHVFERSLGDINAELSADVEPTSTTARRKKHGVYYTSETLAEHLTGSALRALLDERSPSKAPQSNAEVARNLTARQQTLEQLRVIDLACGSGAFLVSAYQAVLEEFNAIQDGLRLTSGAGQVSRRGVQRDLLADVAAVEQSRVLRDTLFGVDLLPQAVEIAKLALWLRSARKGEKVPDLSHNLVAADSLRVSTWLSSIRGQRASFDLVIGNPPWGAELAPNARAEVIRHLGVDNDIDWDSWELFLLLSIDMLRDGGRLALVLPDTLFSEEKARTREILLRDTTVEMCHALGIQWFENVRMGTAILQARKGTPSPSARFKGLLLAGPRRKSAIRGDVLLSQYESRYALDIPQKRCQDDPRHALEISRSDEDDRIIRQMDAASIPLASMCDRGRGEEMNKEGVLWVCRACSNATVPAAKKKLEADDLTQSRYRKKACPKCGATLTEHDTGREWLVTEHGAAVNTGKKTIDYFTGDDVTYRYRQLRKRLELNLDGRDFKYKDAKQFAGPKILIRQAGVGLSATIDATDAHFPQSVYAYRVKAGRRREGYSLEYVMGVLMSRTIAYYLFKRFGQVDPDAPHAKVTHERLADFPIPRVDLNDRAQARLMRQIETAVKNLLVS